MRILLALSVVFLAACQDNADAPDYGMQSYNPNVADLRAQCEARGGRYESLGTGGRLICLTTPRDAGRSCARASDCESACLARSRSCAPVAPLVGCNEVLDGAGRPATLCID